MVVDRSFVSEETWAKIEDLMGRYPDKRSALLQVLHVVQDEKGYLNYDAIKWIATLFRLPPAEVYSVASFYTMYNLKPVGKYLIQVCTNISCSITGADEIVRFIEKKLGIKVGETTPDGKFTLITVECLGSCGKAPAMMINKDYYEELTPEKVERILESLK
ncbi:MAG: NADH-quinone oxidoreductase subunit NuoE [Thermosulfidibacteraceae bacterium]|jgi:NADH-quinone oxidoreductase subunit E